jgi:transposase
MAHHKAEPCSQLLATVPGVGPVTAVSIALKVPNAMDSGRHFAAWLGITPREHSTAGRQRLGKISREGDEGLRRLLVLGATAVIRQVGRRRQANKASGSDSPWLLQLLARNLKKLVAIALANDSGVGVLPIPARTVPPGILPGLSAPSPGR